MATKTISIDTEAYARLKARKAAGESFSQTIKRLVPKLIDIDKWLASLSADPVSDEFVNAIEETIASRRAPQNMKDFDDLSGHNRTSRPAKKTAKSEPSRRGGKSKGVLAER